jgi:glycolate oxidase FAD binding subunit
VSELEAATWPASPAAGPLGDGRPALAILRPETVADLCQEVRDHVSRSHALYPQGGATALDYGGIPRRPGVAIDMRAICPVIDYPHADMTITVGAGITASNLQSILAAEKQRLLIDIPQADRATLGGVFATNTCGPRRFGFGRPRDQIIGVRFVTSEGVEVKGGGRVVKNVAGYDFPKLLTGSMGTLGIITQMTLKVRPLPEASAIAWVPYGTLDAAGVTARALNTSNTRPVAIELLNPMAARLVGEPLNLQSDGWVVAIGVEDNATSVRWQLNRLMIELGRADMTVLEGADSQPLWSALTELQAGQYGPFACVSSVPPSHIASLLNKVTHQSWTIQAHAGNGVIHLHALGEWNLEEANAEVYWLRSACKEFGGHTVVARCPTEWKECLRVWGEPRPDWVLAAKVKRALDPKGALNPGRFVGEI